LLKTVTAAQATAHPKRRRGSEQIFVRYMFAARDVYQQAILTRSAGRYAPVMVREQSRRVELLPVPQKKEPDPCESRAKRCRSAARLLQIL